MKNPKIIFAVIAIIAILGIGAYTLSQNSSQTESIAQKDNSAKENDKIIDDKTAGSRYIRYSKSALDSASDNRRVLFFYASWCPTCKPADANFTQNEIKIPDDVTVIRVNYNDPETDQEEKDLAKKYGIIYQHTFVQIDNTGKEVTKWNGGQIDELLSNIK